MQVDREQWRMCLPLYLGLTGMVMSTIAALGLALDSPDFIIRCHALALLGLALSALGVATGKNPSLLGALIAAVVFPLLVLANTGAPFTRFFFPDETLTEHTLLLPTLAAWGIIALSFAQANRMNSIFIFVCGLVVFGLTGTMYINLSLLLCFFSFLLSTFFVWGYNNVLNLHERATEVGQSIPRNPRRWAHAQVGVGVALTAIVFATSVAAGYPAYTYSPNFFGKMAGHKNLNDYLPRLSNFSGFAQTFSLMGGKITLSDTHVLTIESDEGDLWRGLVYDTYLGNEWTRTEQRFRGGEPKTTHELDARAMPDWQDGPSRINTQRVTIEVPTPGVLIAAATPRKVEFPDRIPGVSQDVYGCVEASLAPDQRSYTVHSAVPFWGPNDLAAAGSTKADYRDVIPDADWEAWENVYIGGVPVETRSALGPLVEEITADCTSAYAKAMAIQAYLYENCKYTLDVPPIPANQDAVTYFVTKTKLGACDLYSSALAIMLRLADVPARVATGYGTGEYSIEKQGYVVTGQEAHAWTEVFFPGYGWVAFDPPSQRAPDRFSWLAKLFQRGWTGPTLRALGKRVGIALILLALVNALVTGVSGSSPAEYIIKWFRARRRSESPRQHVAVAYTSVSRALRKYGVSRSGWQTPTDFARQIGRNEELPDYIRERHGAFTTDFLDLRYGADEPTHSDVRAFTGHADGLARRIRRAARSKGHPPKEQESPPADER